MNLSLARFHCNYLVLSGDVVVPYEVDEKIQQLMRVTRHEVADGTPATATFSSSHSVGAHREWSRVRVVRLGLDDGSQYWFEMLNHVDDDGGPVRRSDKPVQFWVDFGFPLLGKFTVVCQADFEYKESEGYRSRVPFPVPVVLPDVDGITHTEAAEFSRRSASGVEYSVIVRHGEDEGSLLHYVLFSSEMELGRREVRSLRDRCRSISGRLLVHSGGSEIGKTDSGSDC